MDLEDHLQEVSSKLTKMQEGKISEFEDYQTMTQNYEA